MTGMLVLVATPIGNLGDLTPRALQTLQDADVVYCEDTRRTRTLYSAHGLRVAHLVALHEHNEMSQIAEILERITRGETVALVSDAGTPGISDPGSRVAAAVAEAGLTVTTNPGASAVIGALGISGLPTDRFVMEGFVPRKGAERASWLDGWDREQRTIVFYESPKRLGATLSELARRWPERRVAVVRELTKLHEEVLRGTTSSLADHFSSTETLGEITVVLAGAEAPQPVSDETVLRAIDEALAQGDSVRDVATHVSEQLGVPHRHVYALALERKQR